MNDLTPEDRARALEMRNLWANAIGGRKGAVLDLALSRAWLDVEAYVLASHTCPDVESDARVRAWNTIAQHPFFADCYHTEGTLADAMVAKLDAAHTHACKPVWRPTTRDEIEAERDAQSRPTAHSNPQP